MNEKMLTGNSALEGLKNEMVDYLKVKLETVRGMVLPPGEFPMSDGDSTEKILADAKESLARELNGMIDFVKRQTSDFRRLGSPEFQTKESLYAHSCANGLRVVYKKYGDVRASHLLEGAKQRQAVILGIAKNLGIDEERIRF